jgi:hypothetical protein
MAIGPEILLHVSSLTRRQSLRLLSAAAGRRSARDGIERTRVLKRLPVHLQDGAARRARWDILRRRSTTLRQLPPCDAGPVITPSPPLVHVIRRLTYPRCTLTLLPTPPPPSTFVAHAGNAENRLSVGLKKSLNATGIFVAITRT